MVGEERRDDAGGERLPQVECQMRQAHPVGDGAGEPHGVGRAARRLGVVGRVAPQLQRHADGLAAGAGGEQRGDRGVHAAAHGHERAPGRGGQRRARRGGGAERLVQRVGGQLGRVELAGRETAELGGDVARSDPRRGEQRRALRQRDGGGRRGDGRAAAGGLESGGRHALAVQREVDPDQVAARRAAGRTGERLRGYVTAPVRVVQVLGEALGVHGPSVGAGC